jgi:hypothetical protein
MALSSFNAIEEFLQRSSVLFLEMACTDFRMPPAERFPYGADGRGLHVVSYDLIIGIK